MDAASWFADLAASLALIECATPVANFVRASRPGPHRQDVQDKVDAHDHLYRRVLRMAYVTQSFRDLPPETQVDGAVQACIAGHLDEVDDAMLALTDFLASQTADERRYLRDVVREHPDLAMHIGGELERDAGAAGIPETRRRQLRAMMTQLTFRLKTEEPGDIIDEYTAKVRRLSGDDGARAAMFARVLGASARARYSYLASSDAGEGEGQPPSTTELVARGPAQPARRGKRAMRAGGVMMGLGVATVGAAAVIVSAGAELGLYVGTAGVVLSALGLFVLLVGALGYALSRPRPEDPIPTALVIKSKNLKS